MARPRDRADDHAMAATRHPRRVGLHERQRRAEIQRAPAPPALPEVKPRRRRRQIPQRSRSRHDGRAQTTTSPSSPTHTPSTTARCRPTSRAHTLIPRTSHLPPVDSSPEEAGTLGAERRAPSNRAHINPRKRQKRRFRACARACVREVGDRRGASREPPGSAVLDGRCGVGEFTARWRELHPGGSPAIARAHGAPAQGAAPWRRGGSQAVAARRIPAGQIVGRRTERVDGEVL